MHDASTLRPWSTIASKQLKSQLGEDADILVLNDASVSRRGFMAVTNALRAIGLKDLSAEPEKATEEVKAEAEAQEEAPAEEVEKTA